MESDFSTLTTRDYLRILFRRAPVIAALFIALPLTVYLGLQLQTPYYEASVKMLISAKKMVESPYYRELTGMNTTEKITVTQSEIVKSMPILQRTVDALSLHALPLDYEKHFASPLKRFLIDQGLKASAFSNMTAEEQRAFRFRMAIERLRAAITVEPVKDTNTFSIAVRDFDPVMAATIANTVSRSYVIFDLEQQLAEVQLKYGGKHPQVVQMRDNMNKMFKTLNGMPIANADAIGPASVKIIEQAAIPIHAAKQDKKLYLAAALVISLVLGIVLAFLFEYLDPTFKTPLEIEKGLGIPLLGSVPADKKMRDGFYQSLADQIYLIVKDRKLKSIQISPAEENLKPEIISELARRLAAKYGQKVLLIDADLRSPGIHRFFELPEKPGLAELLEGKAVYQQIIRKAEGTLQIISAGTTELNPIMLLDSKRMADLMHDTTATFDLVLVSSPGLMKHKDAVVLSSLVEGTALVVEENKTRREVTKVSVLPLEKLKANILGAILDNRTFPIPRLFYHLF